MCAQKTVADIFHLTRYLVLFPNVILVTKGDVVSGRLFRCTEKIAVQSESVVLILKDFDKRIFPGIRFQYLQLLSVEPSSWAIIS